MVDRLLEFKRFIDKALPVAFSDPDLSAGDVVNYGEGDAAPVEPSRKTNRDFVNAANDAFETGFRVRRNKPAEMIAKFLDRSMRRGQKEASDEEFETLLDEVLGLYRYTQGAHYRSIKQFVLTPL